MAAARLGLAAPAEEEPSWPAVELAHSGWRDLISAINGRTYRIFLSRPPVAAPAAGFPVLYLLDGDAYFPLLAQLARLAEGRAAGGIIAPAVVVGVGYPPEADRVSRRFFDLTPAYSRTALPPRPDGRPWPEGGGAGLFARVLHEEVKPLIERAVAADPSRQTLIGHSLGGLFALHRLFTSPGAFSRYVASSPSIWFDDRRILEEAESFLANAPSRPPLLITVGEQETSAGPGQPPAERPQDGMAGMARALAERLQADFLEFEGENHLSVVPAMLSRSLRFGTSSG